jgi:hypothetical protein
MAQEALVDPGRRDGFVSTDKRGKRVPCLDWFTQSVKQTAKIIEEDGQGIELEDEPVLGDQVTDLLARETDLRDSELLRMYLKPRDR